jgi:hypothetical protein
VFPGSTFLCPTVDEKLHFLTTLTPGSGLIAVLAADGGDSELGVVGFVGLNCVGDDDGVTGETRLYVIIFSLGFIDNLL